MSSVLPFTYKIGTTLTSPFPGAYIFVGSAGANGMVPIYTSMPSFIGDGLTEFLNNKDAQVLVLPGYYLQLFANTSYDNTLTPFDNTEGTDIMYVNASSLSASSCKLFYKFRTGLADLPTSLRTSVTITTTASSSNFTMNGVFISNPVTYIGTQYRLYRFTANGTFSVADSDGVGVHILCLLIGGGGGGGHYGGAYGEGAAGGGAGAFVTTTIAAAPGSTFTVTIGNGGSNVGGEDGGGQGSSSSISNGSSVLTVGGGGGGGAGNARNGIASTPYGSTGGAWGGYQYNGTYGVSGTAGTSYAITGSSVFINIASMVNKGGDANYGAGGGGGGGAGAAAATTSGANGSAGGSGATWFVTGSSLYYAGGGGGGNITTAGYAGGGGAGGGGAAAAGVAGTPNTGSGGGAGWAGNASGSGGSGICIIAVPVYRLAA